MPSAYTAKPGLLNVLKLFPDKVNLHIIDLFLGEAKAHAEREFDQEENVEDYLGCPEEYQLRER
jgi:hypothetical protein